jgi:hypothetical protein
MKKPIAILLWFCLAVEAYGQHFASMNPESISLGQVQNTLNNVWSTGNNPSLLAKTEHPALGFSIYAPHSLKELSTASCGGRFNMNQNLGIGILYVYSGYHAAHEQSLFIGAGKKINKQICLGVSIGSSRQVFGAEKPFIQFPLVLGVSYQISAAANLTASMHSTGLQMSTSSMRIGTLWKAGKSSTVHVEVSQGFSQKLSLRLGLIHHVRKPLSLMIGVGYQPTCVSFGFRLTRDSLNILSGTSRHQTLGFTPSFGLEITRSDA